MDVPVIRTIGFTASSCVMGKDVSDQIVAVAAPTAASTNPDRVERRNPRPGQDAEQDRKPGDDRSEEPEGRIDQRLERELHRLPAAAGVVETLRSLRRRARPGKSLDDEPDAPRKRQRDGDESRERESGPPCAAFADRRDERRDEMRQARRGSFALGEHRSTEADRGGGELPGRALDDPQHDEQSRHRREIAEWEICIGPT